jgi:hypothetical protein
LTSAAIILCKVAVLMLYSMSLEVCGSNENYAYNDIFPA